MDTYVEAKEGSVYSKGGEVIVPASGETAEDIARAATVDKSGILFGGDLNVVMPNKDINSAFMAISISNGNSQRELAKKAQGKSVVHIHNEEIRNLIVPFPNKVEQDKIVDYFTNLDRLITLHQCKCQLLLKLLHNDWEQRKLGDVFEQTSNLVNPKEDEIELWSLTVEDGLTKKSDRYNREFLVKKDDNFKEVRPGDIVYNPMNMTLGAVGYNGMAKSVAVSGYYTTMVAKENYDTYYINTWLKSPQAIRLYRTYATGSLIEKQRVQFPTLSIIPVTFPKYEEQIKIGSYFHSLDNLITLHQRKNFYF